jgi:DegV family protein with EDD domain
MAVRIVTDSTADMPRQIARDLGIAVVPIYILIGDNSYRDRVDIQEDEMYRRMQRGPVFLTTAPPTPQDFADVYTDLAQGAEGIVSIHIAKTLSGTYDSAVQGKEIAKCACPIEVIDSNSVTAGLGILAMQAARYANRGAHIDALAQKIRGMVDSIEIVCMVDTLEYLVRGGRLAKGKSIMGSVFKVKPIISVKNGELSLTDSVHSREKGLEWIYNYAKNVRALQDVTVAYTTDHVEVDALLDRMDRIFPRERIIKTKLGCVLGAHLGPGALVVGMRGVSKT